MYFHLRFLLEFLSRFLHKIDSSAVPGNPQSISWVILDFFPRFFAVISLKCFKRIFPSLLFEFVSFLAAFSGISPIVASRVLLRMVFP